MNAAKYDYIGISRCCLPRKAKGISNIISYLLDRWYNEKSFNIVAAQGYGTGQQLLLYKRLASRIRHELVILAYYLGNDVEDNISDEKRRPFVDVSDTDNSILLVRKPVKVIDHRVIKITKDSTLIERIDSALQPVQNYLWDYTEIYPYVVSHAKIALNLLPRPGAAVPPMDGIPHTRKLLSRLLELTQENGAKTLLVLVPESGEINPHKITEFTAETGAPFWNAQRQMIRELAGQFDHVELIDLASIFREALRSGEEPYGKADFHASAAGHRIIARAIAERMEAAYGLPVPTNENMKRSFVDFELGAHPSKPACELFGKIRG